MIEIRDNALSFSFPEIHPDARIDVEFQRTLRIPDDENSYPLPPGLGAFPVRHVDDYAARIPSEWLERGGVMLPMYQSEAMWISLRANYVSAREVAYPFAVKVAAGKINAVTGEPWKDRLNKKPQDYLVAPVQLWLDGFCVEKGFIRQFVAMPLGTGYTVEEQLTGEAVHGGVQISVYPMKLDVFKKRFPKHRRRKMESHDLCCMSAPAAAGMGLAAGGRMRQEIYEDPYGMKDWDLRQGSRCFVHIANSLMWRLITHERPPTQPPTAQDYNRAGLPWFEYYDDSAKAVKGGGALKKVKSVATIKASRKELDRTPQTSITPEVVIQLRKGLKDGQVREWNSR